MFELLPVGRRSMSVSCAIAAVTAIGMSAAFLCGSCLAVETADSGATPLANDAAEPAAEVIRERYPDGTVKIERDVTTDPDGNYVNHGAWRMWNELGGLVGEGRYEMGWRTGQWSRWFSRAEAPLLDTHPFDEFEAPFVSRATFAAGELEGEWTIADAQDRKCSSVVFRRGKRDGTATLWQKDGEVCREATFRNGVAVGDVRERNADGRLDTIATYVDGHQLVNKVTNFSGTDKKKSEASYLAAAVNEATPDDYWQLRFAEYSARSKSVRHGAWKTWFANGQVESEGTYQFDRENGNFTWWHANGQPAVEGQFVDGQEDGRWVWWHANGQKAAQGDYHYGKLVGSWRGWSDDGRLVQRDEYGDGRADSKTQQTALQAAPDVSATEMAR
jgi:antitoxin component YwqK of YwqJK toxin-antitoxin module